MNLPMFDFENDFLIYHNHNKRKKNDELDYVKLKSFFITKETNNKMKMQPAEWNKNSFVTTR